MKRFKAIALTVLITGFLAACAARPTATPVPAASPLPTATSVPTATLLPTDTPPPTSSPFPTPYEVAPEETFREVGSVAALSGSNSVAGKVIIAGLQTLIIQGFTYDGKASQIDIRLVKGDDYANPAHVFIELEERPYDAEFFLFRIPSTVTREQVDRIIVYDRTSGQAIGVGVFD